MSEYQYYEFLALDRSLTDRQQAEVRALSTRAQITATSFTNDYHWGDFKGDPNELMERYYDAHLYYANWGTRRLVLRLPASLLDLATTEQYAVGEQVCAWTSGEHVIVDLTFQEEEETWDLDLDHMLSSLVRVRAELAGGDLRPLYLAWLSAYGGWERDEDAFDYDEEDVLEPPVPAGLGALTAAQRALADFLRLDNDLLAVAAQASPAAHAAGDDRAALTAWVKGLTEARKDALLMRVATGDAARVELELRREFAGPAATADGPRRTVGQLLDATDQVRQARQRDEAALREAELERREQQRKQARERHLAELAGEGERAWARVEAFIDTKKPREYDQAVEMLRDLRELAYRDDRMSQFTGQFTRLRERHQGKPSLVKRFNDAGLVGE
ncbi:hypothetical protein GCM10009555_034240 [Acrocarpospora macrocephala]|uniref:Uncharacterized protein n=1 Tax=Acrocarpospora macrocephala TaxID=150177 RepID=A0A5M3WC20_9ACTN|nr:hypothetical protein [Acrocarpospora macrocephala]GES06605.1 hypothetical protein Amac_002000 [Acrocarpospora macrocephala]